jgi:hypothetical protein
MSEEWSTVKGSKTDHPSDDYRTQRHDGIPNGPDDETTPNSLHDAASHSHPPHYPPPHAYLHHDRYGPPPPGGMVPPPPIPPEAAAAAAAGYPPMPPHFQQSHYHPSYGPPPPYGHMYPPYGNSPYGPPPPYHPPPYGYDHSVPPHHQAYNEHGITSYSEDHDGTLDPEDEDDGFNESEEIGTFGSAARMKMYVKSKVPTRQEILDRRARKNAQSRSRASKLREKMLELKVKEEQGKTEEEKLLFDQFEARRKRKNDRSRERAIEKKSEIDRILNKPERKRTKIERQFLETALTAKQRKNEGDRLRRQRLKSMGRGKGHGGANIPPHLAYGGSEMSMSPPSGNQYPQNPGHYPYPNPHGPPGPMEGPGVVPMTFVPPPHERIPHQPSQVEQRRHPDGTITISIGGNRGEEMGDMLLMYGDNAGDDSNEEKDEDEDDE